MAKGCKQSQQNVLGSPRQGTLGLSTRTWEDMRKPRVSGPAPLSESTDCSHLLWGQARKGQLGATKRHAPKREGPQGIYMHANQECFRCLLTPTTMELQGHEGRSSLEMA